MSARIVGRLDIRNGTATPPDGGKAGKGWSKVRGKGKDNNGGKAKEACTW